MAMTKGNRQMLGWGAGAVLVLFGLSAIASGGKDRAANPPPPDPHERAVEFKWVAGQAIQTFTIEPGETRESILAAVRAACDRQPFCQIYGWADPAQQATAWPMLDREADALAFRYAVNRATGYEETSWFCGSPGAGKDCARFGDGAPSE